MKAKPFTILYQDEDIIAVHKAAGLLVAADRWDTEAERLDVLLQTALKEAGQQNTLYAVHRIDKDTSGVLIYARNAEAHRALNTAFQNRTVHKTYHALVHGCVRSQAFTVTLPLRADGDALHRTIVDKRRGKEAVTVCTVLESYRQFTLIEAQPVTGRTHQIRVHLAQSGYPIVCDPLYGSKEPVYLSALKPKWHGDPYTERPLIQRLALHAARIECMHPRNHTELSVAAAYPKDFKSLIHQLQKL